MNFLRTSNTMVLFAASMCSIAQAVTVDEYTACGLVYGALFQAAKNAQHEGMLTYTRPRLQAVLPYLQQNRDNPGAKEKLRETAIRLEGEVGSAFVKQATKAILEEDKDKLRFVMARVFQCDRAFGLSTLPLPLKAKQVPPLNEYLRGFYSGCLAKQKKSVTPFTDFQIQGYCRCMTDAAAIDGIDASSPGDALGHSIKRNHDSCVVRIK